MHPFGALVECLANFTLALVHSLMEDGSTTAIDRGFLKVLAPAPRAVLAAAALTEVRGFRKTLERGFVPLRGEILPPPLNVRQRGHLGAEYIDVAGAMKRVSYATQRPALP